MEPVGVQSASPKYIVLHHTDISCWKHPEQVNIIDGAHKRRGYLESSTGNHIAYHWFVGCDGTTVNTRPEGEPSTHTGCGLGEDRCINGYEQINENSIAVVIAGATEEDMPSKEAEEAFKRKVFELKEKYNIPNGNIVSHGDTSPSICAGRYIKNMLPVFNQ